MPVRPIVRLGHPALRRPAEPVDPARVADPELQNLIDDMFETMLEAEGVGLAAPQLGIELRLFVYMVIDLDAEPHDEEQPPELRVLINPTLDPGPGELIDDWEGCLSISDLRGLVPRHPTVQVHALDRDGRSLNYRAEGYEARVIQHEHDHLNGVVFLDRMRDLRSLAFAAEWARNLAAENDREDGRVD